MMMIGMMIRRYGSIKTLLFRLFWVPSPIGRYPRNHSAIWWRFACQGTNLSCTHSSHFLYEKHSKFWCGIVFETRWGGLRLSMESARCPIKISRGSCFTAVKPVDNHPRLTKTLLTNISRCWWIFRAYRGLANSWFPPVVWLSDGSFAMYIEVWYIESELMLEDPGSICNWMLLEKDWLVAEYGRKGLRVSRMCWSLKVLGALSLYEFSGFGSVLNDFELITERLFFWITAESNALTYPWFCEDLSSD